MNSSIRYLNTYLGLGSDLAQPPRREVRQAGNEFLKPRSTPNKRTSEKKGFLRVWYISRLNLGVSVVGTLASRRLIRPLNPVEMAFFWRADC